MLIVKQNVPRRVVDGLAGRARVCVQDQVDNNARGTIASRCSRLASTEDVDVRAALALLQCRQRRGTAVCQEEGGSGSKNLVHDERSENYEYPDESDCVATFEKTLPRAPRTITFMAVVWNHGVNASFPPNMSIFLQ